jgi:hypothetical protein
MRSSSSSHSNSLYEKIKILHYEIEEKTLAIEKLNQNYTFALRKIKELEEANTALSQSTESTSIVQLETKFQNSMKIIKEMERKEKSLKKEIEALRASLDKAPQRMDMQMSGRGISSSATAFGSSRSCSTHNKSTEDSLSCLRSAIQSYLFAKSIPETEYYAKAVCDELETTNQLTTSHGYQGVVSAYHVSDLSGVKLEGDKSTLVASSTTNNSSNMVIKDHLYSHMIKLAPLIIAYSSFESISEEFHHTIEQMVCGKHQVQSPQSVQQEQPEAASLLQSTGLQLSPVQPEVCETMRFSEVTHSNRRLWPMLGHALADQ